MSRFCTTVTTVLGLAGFKIADAAEIEGQLKALGYPYRLVSVIVLIGRFGYAVGALLVIIRLFSSDYMCHSFFIL